MQPFSRDAASHFIQRDVRVKLVGSLGRRSSLLFLWFAFALLSVVVCLSPVLSFSPFSKQEHHFGNITKKRKTGKSQKHRSKTAPASFISSDPVLSVCLLRELRSRSVVGVSHFSYGWVPPLRAMVCQTGRPQIRRLKKKRPSAGQNNGRSR